MSNQRVVQSIVKIAEADKIKVMKCKRFLVKFFRGYKFIDKL